MTSGYEESTPGRLPWELAEIAGVGLLVSAIAFAVFGIVSGIVFAIESQPQISTTFNEELPAVLGPNTAEIVQHSTAWATPFLGLLVLAAVATAWWSARDWDPEIEDPEIEEEGGPIPEVDYVAAFGHHQGERDRHGSARISRRSCRRRCRARGCDHQCQLRLGRLGDCVSRPERDRRRHFYARAGRSGLLCRCVDQRFGAGSLRRGR